MGKRSKPNSPSSTLFVQEQPKPGDVVAHCGHLNRPPHHFFRVPDGNFEYERMDGMMVTAQWAALCCDCFAKHAENPYAALQYDDVWTSTEPILRKAVN